MRIKFLCMGECGLTTFSIGPLYECAHCGGRMSPVASPTDMPSTLAHMTEDMKEYVDENWDVQATPINESAIARYTEEGMEQLTRYLRG